MRTPARVYTKVSKRKDFDQLAGQGCELGLMWIPVQLHLRSSLNVESIACSYGVCHVPVGIRGTQYYGRTHLHTVALHRRDVCRNHSSIYYFNASCTCVFSLTSLIVVASGSGAWAPLRVAIFFIFQRWGLRVWRKLKRLEVQKEKKKRQFDTTTTFTSESWALGVPTCYYYDSVQMTRRLAWPQSCMKAITRRVETT